MPTSYRVFYAGAPHTRLEIRAASAKEAAMAFFARQPCRNSIIVNSGLLREETFRWSDFADAVPELNAATLPLHPPAASPYDPAKDPAVIVYRIIAIAIGVAILAGGVWLIADGTQPIAGAFLLVPGIIQLLFGSLASSGTLRRVIARRWIR